MIWSFEKAQDVTNWFDKRRLEYSRERVTEGNHSYRKERALQVIQSDVPVPFFAMKKETEQGLVAPIPIPVPFVWMMASPHI